MSRGGRGGFRGGRGGGFGRGKMGGMDLPWEYDPDLKIETKPTELFPENPSPLAEPPARAERSRVTHYRLLRERIHEGPLYTVLGDSFRVTKRGSQTVPLFNPFEGMPTYAIKYQKQRRRIPRLDTRPYVMRFFPKELWNTLDPDHTVTSDADGQQKRKRKLLQISNRSRVSRLDELEEEHRNLDKGDNDEMEDDPEEDGEEEEEEQDDDFSEDDFDQDDDYNGEKYFNTGEDDYGDDEFGGGGGEDDNYY